MGDLEYLDWKESLKSCPLEKIQAALDRIMLHPPKTEQGEYRGRPTIVDVLRTMDILAEERAAQWREEQAEKKRQEQRKLEQRRTEFPEEFIGMKELQEIASKLHGAVKPMPTVRTIFPDIDPEKNAEKLRRQAEILAEMKQKGLIQ